MRKIYAFFALLTLSMILASCAKSQPAEIQDNENCSENSRFKDDC